MAEKYWTTKDVMEILPLGRSKCVRIIKSLPHINVGRKLLVEPEAVRGWIRMNTVCPREVEAPVMRSKKAKAVRVEPLTQNGLIPKRKLEGEK